MSREDGTTRQPERFSDRVSSPMAKFLVDFDQRYGELRGETGSFLLQVCEDSLAIDTQIQHVAQFVEQYGTPSIHNTRDYAHVDYEAYHKMRKAIQSEEGREATFQETRQFVALIRSDLFTQADRYLRLKKGLAELFPGKSIDELTWEEIKTLHDLEYDSTKKELQKPPSLLFDTRYWPTSDLRSDLTDEHIDKLAAYEAQDNEVGELARQIHYKDLALMQMIAVDRIRNLRNTGAWQGFYVNDALDPEKFILYQDYPPAFGGNPTTYEESRKFSRPFSPQVQKWVDRGIGDFEFYQYTTPYDFAFDLERITDVMYDDPNSVPEYMEVRRLAEAFNIKSVADYQPQEFQLALQILRQKMYQDILGLFSTVDERIHPKVEYKLKRFAAYIITSGTSSKLFDAAGRVENPYHELTNMQLPLKDLKPYLVKVGLSYGLFPPHLSNQ